MTIALVPFNIAYLDRSWVWLHDPEIKALTMTPDFTRQDQRRFFDGLADRADYKVWGVELEGEGPIGAAGLKNIIGDSAEYWGYFGEKTAWGQGLGKQMLDAVEAQAAAIGINRLHLTVSRGNVRAIALYERAGFVASTPRSDTLMMAKVLNDA